MAVVHIDAAHIVDWDSLHDVFAENLGFPDFYGRNMDAWIDCLTYADEDDGMRSITMKPGEVLTLQINGYESLKRRLPELAQAIVECAAFVNYRRIEAGQQAVIALSFWR